MRGLGIGDWGLWVLGFLVWGKDPNPKPKTQNKKKQKKKK